MFLSNAFLGAADLVHHPSWNSVIFGIANQSWHRVQRISVVERSWIRAGWESKCRVVMDVELRSTELGGRSAG
jgi:hypothetical protein